MRKPWPRPQDPLVSAAEDAVYELDPYYRLVSPERLRSLSSQRAAQGWSFVGAATAPDGHQFLIWRRGAHGSGHGAPGRVPTVPSELRKEAV